MEDSARVGRKNAERGSVSPWTTLACGLLLVLIGAAPRAQVNEGVQPGEFSDDAFGVSYLYAAVMGSGTYKIDGRRITMLRAPVAFNQREVTPEKAGIRWYVPFVIGSDEIKNLEWLGDVFDRNLVTLTALPGVEYQWQATPNWLVKPFAHLGGGHDFVSHETMLMSVAGIRMLGTWSLGEKAEFRWGGSFRLAYEQQLKSGDEYSFSLSETGIDYRHDTPYRWKERTLNAGAYYRFRYFKPDWKLAQSPLRRSDTEFLHEVGVSVGFSRPIPFLGFKFSRIRLGYNLGEDLKGLTIGTEFPF